MSNKFVPKGLTPKELAAWLFEQEMQKNKEEKDNSPFNRDLRIKR